MSTERHKCRLCSKNFSNGRALGGHMSSHLLPLPPTSSSKRTRQQLTESDSSSSSSKQLLQQQLEDDEVLIAELKGDQVAENEKEVCGVAISYGLREKPKKSVKVSDPEFLDGGSGSSSAVVQVAEDEDRESETNSTHQNPTRKRSKRTPSHKFSSAAATAKVVQHQEATKSPIPAQKATAIASESVTTESIPLSSISDGSQDEEVALWLMMLSKDKWVRTAKEEKSADNNTNAAESSSKSNKLPIKTNHNASTDVAATTSVHNKTTTRAKHKCVVCRKNFRSQKALSGHKATSKMCQERNAAAVVAEEISNNFANVSSNTGGGAHIEAQKIYECPFCYKVFGSGQALGGHKRSHLLALGTTSAAAAAVGAATTEATATRPTPRVATAETGGHGDDTSSSHNIADYHKVSSGNCFIDLNLPAPTEDDEFSAVSDAALINKKHY